MNNETPSPELLEYTQRLSKWELTNTELQDLIDAEKIRQAVNARLQNWVYRNTEIIKKG